MRMRCLYAGVFAALLTITRGAAAQSAGGTLIPIPFRTYVAFDPLLVPFDIGSFEVETALAPGITAGGVASYTNVDSDRYTSFDLNLRYYPGEVVLRGFSVGLSGGFLRYSSHVGPANARESVDAPTLGVLVDYNWMLGVNRRFLVGTGLGAKRVLAGESERSSVGLGRAYGTARFVIGYAF
jgi:hypothetical protein